MQGYHRCYYRIDLSDRTLLPIDLPAEVLSAYIGGVGLGTWILLQETDPTADAFDPSAALVIALSPLVGSPLTTSAKFAIVAKSPLTHRLNDSLSSSHFAIQAKKTGADAIALTEQADDWSVVLVDDGNFQMLPAGHLLGLSATETQQQLKRQLGSSWSILAIGPAGEQRVPFATISHGNRHAGRGGLGAVLGSKRIKAIAVCGTQRTIFADTVGLTELARTVSQKSFGPATEKYREMGTVANLLTFNRLSVLPTRNFQQSSFEAAEAISGEAFAKIRGKVRESCAACTIGCEHLFPSNNGQPVRLEYESLFALGSLCGIGEQRAVVEAAKACDHYGLDTISMGATFAFACECVERGLLAMPGDIRLRFGDSEALLTAIERTAYRQGTGKLLALGTRELACRLKGNALDFAPQVKGLEIPGYDPRSLKTIGLGFAVSSRGADHNRSGAYEVDFARPKISAAERARAAIETEDRSALLDSLILCKFLRGVFDDIFAESARMLELITGESWSAKRLRHQAKQIVLLKRLFNERAGWTCEEDRLPKRFLKPSPGAQLTAEELQSLIHEYYRLRGLDARGRLPEGFAEKGCAPERFSPPKRSAD